MEKQKSVNNTIWFFTVLAVAMIAGFAAIYFGWPQFQSPAMKLAAALAMLIAIRANLVNDQNKMAAAWWAVWIADLGWLTDELLPKFGPEWTTWAVGAGAGFLLSLLLVVGALMRASPKKDDKPQKQQSGNSSGPKKMRTDELHMTVGGFPGRESKGLDIGEHEEKLAQNMHNQTRADLHSGMAQHRQAIVQEAQYLEGLLEKKFLDAETFARHLSELFGVQLQVNKPEEKPEKDDATKSRRTIKITRHGGPSVIDPHREKRRK